MISYVKGPGGLGRRVLAEAVPFWAGAVAAATVMPFVAIPLTVVVGLVVWIAVSALLRWIRGRERLCRLYRIALTLHIICWSALGVMHSHLGDAAPLGTPTTHDWGAFTTVRVGAATAPFELPERATLAGWGQYPRRLRFAPFGGFGVIGRLGQEFMGGGDGAPRLPLFRAADEADAHDLGARAFVVVPEDLPGAAPVALVRLDLVTIERAVSDEITKRLAPLGFRPETVTVSATHTHSGPGGYSRQPLSEMVGTDHFDAEVHEAIVAAAVRAVTEAHSSSTPAVLDAVQARDRDPTTGTPRVARNRRLPDPNEIDDAVWLLRGTWDGGGAALVNYAVHPILQRRRTTTFSRDLAGDIERAFGARYGTTIFVNGAAADISPRHGTTTGAERGEQLAADLLRPFDTPAPGAAPQRVRVRAARVVRHLGAPHAIFGAGDRDNLIEAAEEGVLGGGPAAILADVVALPVNMAIWSSGVTEARTAFRFSGGAGVMVNLELSVPENEHAFGAIVFEIEGADRPINLLWGPAEATQALGKLWRREIADGFFFGYTNGVMAYVTTNAEYGLDSYEAQSTLYGRRTGAMVTECLRAAYDAATSSDADR